MKKSEEAPSFITWSDVHELTRWLEYGYGGRFKFVMTVACPKGEQHLRQYWEVKWCDDALQERPLTQRVLARYPTLAGQSLAAALIGLLYQVDAVLSKEAVWAEPGIAVKPRRATH